MIYNYGKAAEVWARFPKQKQKDMKSGQSGELHIWKKDLSANSPVNLNKTERNYPI
jgi:hypothetical protein